MRLPLLFHMFALAAAGCAVSGCLAATAAGAALGVAGAAVKTTAKAGSAVVGAVIPDDKDKAEED